MGPATAAPPPIPYLGEILSLGAALVWSVAILLYRTASLQVRPLVLNLFKNVVSIVLFVVTLAVVGDLSSAWRIAPSDLWMLFLSAFTALYLGDTILFATLKRIGVSLSLLLGCFYAPAAVFFSWLLLDESLPRLILVGGLAVTGGIALVSSDRVGLPHGITRRDLAIGVCMGTLVRMVLGTIPLTLHLLVTRRTAEIAAVFKPSRSYGILLPATLLGTYLGMLTWLGGIKYTDASTASILNQTTPLFGLPLAAVFLNERLTWRKVLGTVISIGGIVAIFLK